MTTKRILTLAAIGTLAAVSTVAFSITNGASVSAIDADGAIALHIAADGQYFEYDGAKQFIEPVTKNSCVIANVTGQSLIDLAASATTSTKAVPGYANFGLGVRESQSSGNGNPCSQIASNETLKLSASAALGRKFTKVRLDLEMTGNAVAKLTLSNGGAAPKQTFYLETGTNIEPAEKLEPDYTTVAPYVVYSGVTDKDGNPMSLQTVDGCAKPSSSGPNSFGNDNCEWHVDPGFAFDTIEMGSVVGITNTSGTVTIEGGGDFSDGLNHDTLLYVTGAAPVAKNDSAEVDKNTPLTTPKNDVTINVLGNDTDGDGDPLTIGSVTDPDPHGTTQIITEGGVEKVKYTPNDNFVGVETFSYTAFDGTYQSNPATVSVRVCSEGTEVLASGPVEASFTRLTELEACKSNTVAVDVNASTVLFQPEGDAGSPLADYRGFITFGPRPIVLNGGAIQLKLMYDANGGTTFVPVPWCDNPQFDADGNVTTAVVPDVNPGGDSWCIASESTVGSGTDNAITTWQVFGQDDPQFH